jgi:hypothetical protein
MFHRFKLKTNEHILINLHNVIRVTLSGKDIHYEMNVLDGGRCNPKNYFFTYNSIKEAEEEFEIISKKFELK